MKKIYKVLLLVCLFCVFTSCNYLDVVPDEKATEKDAFEDTNAAKRFLYSCYTYLPNPRSGTGSLDLMTSDEVVTAFEHETFANFPKGNYSPSTMHSTNGSLRKMSYWNTLFQGLRQCYILLNNIDNVPNMDSSLKSDYIAQTKFLIGYYHFLLARCYGPIILIKEEPSISTSPADYAPRTSYDECVQYICDMFDEAAVDLPITRVGAEYGLATKVAAKGLKAKLLLYAASPLFNGNTEYYGGDKFLNKDGTLLMPQTYDAAKWTKAKAAFEEAIALAESAGAGLYINNDFTSVEGYVNLEPTDQVQRNLRYNILEAGNSDILWADCRGEGAYSIQNKSLPFYPSAAYNGVAPTITMLKRFYTKNGLPIDKDPEFNYNDMYEIVTVGADDADIADQGSKTIRFNLDREPRYYAWIAFQSGFFEIMSSADGDGAYKNDASYLKYSSLDYGKLVCDFVLGGNTSRGTATNQRTNNYSPTGFLNKKGVVPGYPVKTSLTDKPPFYPWPVLRLADLYLGCAEASAESGDLSTAKKYLDYVREHAGIPKVDESWAKIGVTLTKEQLIEVIRQERMVEFYLENQTFWDIRRWKLGDEYFNVKARGMNINATTIDDYAKETEVVFERKFSTPSQYLMPIPIDDVDKNVNLVQNPGY